MKKLTLVIFFIVLSLSLVSCKKITNEEIIETVSEHLGVEIDSVDVVEEEKDDGKWFIEAELTKNDGIYTSVCEAELTYKSKKGEWDLVDYEPKEWLTYPTASAVDDKALFIDYLSKTSFTTSSGSLNYNKDYVTLEELKSVNLNLKAPYSDEIRGKIKYDTPNGSGTCEGIFKMIFGQNQWVVSQFIQDAPMQFEWKPDKGFEIEVSELLRSMGETWNIDLEVKDESINEVCRIKPSDIKEVGVISQPALVANDVAEAKVHFVADKGVATVVTDAIVRYRLRDLKWYLESVTKVSEKQSIKYKTDMLGTWDGYYIIGGNKRNAVVEFTNFIKHNNLYEGVFSFSSSDTFESPSGKFEITGYYELNNNRFVIKAGNWIDCPSGYLTVNFYIDSVQDKTIFGSAQWYGNQDYINLTKK